MRASLFLSALCVASLVGGSAAAERPDKDESRPRITRERSQREVSPLEKSRDRFVDRGNKAEKVEKAEPAMRYQSKEKGKITEAGRLSKAEMNSKLPKQAMERVRCSEAGEDCASGRSAKKSAQSNADRGVKTAKAPTTTSDRGKAQAPNAAERALLQKMLNAKCSNKARGGCASDGSDNF